MTQHQHPHRVLIPERVDYASAMPEGEVHVLSGACMGTTWSVRVVTPGPDEQKTLQADVGTILENIEAQMSHFRENSELSRFSQLQVGERLCLSDEFAYVMRVALEVARVSEGAFDPTLARVIEAWGFGARNRFSEPGFVPPSAPLHTSAAWQELEVDECNCLMQSGNVSLNLAAIAKGFAVDAISSFLRHKGLTNHLVEVGGELYGSGIKPDLQPWWVALEAPAADCSLPATRIALHGLSVATSGNYRRRYRIGGKDVQHTIDPRDGKPVEHTLSSVTVVHEKCIYADAFATAIMVLGPRPGLVFAEKLGLKALLQWRSNDGQWLEAASSAFKILQQ